MMREFRQVRDPNNPKGGSWFMNRTVYFRFHQYPKYGLHIILSLTLGTVMFIVSLNLMKSEFLWSLLTFYISYVLLLSFVLLQRRVCRYRGYFLYPKRIVKFFRSIEVDMSIDDFDSVATMRTKR